MAFATNKVLQAYLDKSSCWAMTWGGGDTCQGGNHEAEHTFSLRQGKPGGFQPGLFPLSSGKVVIVSRILLGLFLVGAFV